jgi:hypothetical protein
MMAADNTTTRPGPHRFQQQPPPGLASFANHGSDGDGLDPRTWQNSQRAGHGPIASSRTSKGDTHTYFNGNRTGHFSFVPGDDAFPTVSHQHEWYRGATAGTSSLEPDKPTELRRYGQDRRHRRGEIGDYQLADPSTSSRCAAGPMGLTGSSNNRDGSMSQIDDRPLLGSKGSTGTIDTVIQVGDDEGTPHLRNHGSMSTKRTTVVKDASVLSSQAYCTSPKPQPERVSSLPRQRAQGQNSAQIAASRAVTRDDLRGLGSKA